LTGSRRRPQASPVTSNRRYWKGDAKPKPPEDPPNHAALRRPLLQHWRSPESGQHPHPGRRTSPSMTPHGEPFPLSSLTVGSES
jgi:hypothetical protein